MPSQNPEQSPNIDKHPAIQPEAGKDFYDSAQGRETPSVRPEYESAGLAEHVEQNIARGGVDKLNGKDATHETIPGVILPVEPRSVEETLAHLQNLITNTPKASNEGGQFHRQQAELEAALFPPSNPDK